MATAIPSSSSSSDSTIATSPPTGCPFYQRSRMGGLVSWVTHTWSFFSNERLKFAREILRTDTPGIYKDYEWGSLPHSPNSLFITNSHMINKIVSQVRDGDRLSSGLEFQWGLTQGTGNESPLTITDPGRHHKLRRFCEGNEFGLKGIHASMPSIAKIALDFAAALQPGENYDTTQLIPKYTIQQTATNILKIKVDEKQVEHIARTIASVEERITNFMLLHVKDLILAQLQDFIDGESCFRDLEELADNVMQQSDATGALFTLSAAVPVDSAIISVLRFLKDLFHKLLSINSVETSELSNFSAETAAENVNETPKGIIRTMIDSGLFSYDEIKSLTRTILFIGSGTTKSAITSILYCLMRDPELQERIFESIKDIDLNNPNGKELYEQLDQHEELNCLLLEVLRLFPPIMFQIRETKEDFQCNGLAIPAGTSLYMSLIHSYRDERRWPDPKKCDPSRFKKMSEEERAQDLVHKLKPFSDGHTKCIGKKVADISIKTIICALLQSFEIIHPPGMEVQHKKIKGGMTLGFDTPLVVQFKKREPV